MSVSAGGTASTRSSRTQPSPNTVAAASTSSRNRSNDTTAAALLIGSGSRPAGAPAIVPPEGSASGSASGERSGVIMAGSISAATWGSASTACSIAAMLVLGFHVSRQASCRFLSAVVPVPPPTAKSSVTRGGLNLGSRFFSAENNVSERKVASLSIELAQKFQYEW